MSTLHRREFLTLVAGAVAMAAVPASARAQGRIAPGDDDVLAVIDVQNCFLPGGTLPVPEGDKVIPIINKLAPAFRNVDWNDTIVFGARHSDGLGSVAGQHRHD